MQLIKSAYTISFYFASAESSVKKNGSMKNDKLLASHEYLQLDVMGFFNRIVNYD